MSLIKKFTNHDYIITVGIFLLSLISLLLIFSTTYNAKTAEAGAGTFRKQILFFIIGFLVYFAISSFDITWLKNYKILFLIYIATILALIYVKFFTPEVASTNRWINIFGFNIQPSEYAKVTLTLTTAAILGLSDSIVGDFVEWNKKIKKEGNIYIFRLKKLLFLLNEKFPRAINYIFVLLTALPVVLLVFIQPAFGNSIIISVLITCVAYAASSDQLKTLNLLVPIVLIALISWNILKLNEIFHFGPDILNVNIFILIVLVIFTLLSTLKTKAAWYLALCAIVVGLFVRPMTMTAWKSSILDPYQKQRIETFFQSPEKDPLNAGYQVRQSKIAIGAGRFWGRGYLKGTQSTLQVLPFAHTDFIFASLAEQFGLFGCILLLGIYLVILLRIIDTAVTSRDEFGFLVCIGIAIMLTLNLFINIGMNQGKLPVTGITLPFVSYGGSSILINMIGLGLVQSVRANRTVKDISEVYTPSSSPWV